MADSPRIVDADVHCFPELVDLYPYMAAQWRDYVRDGGNFARTPAGVAYTYPPWSPLGNRTAEATLDGLRAAVLDRASLAILNAYFGVETLRHPFMAAALASAVNAWLREEWLEREPRLRASLVITPQDTDEAVAEIERVGDDPRFVQLFLPARAWEPYGARRYWPIWRAAAERGLALGIHFGGLTGEPPTPVGRFGSYFEEYTAAPHLFATHVMSLVASGIFEELPSLRISALESGVTWLPTLLWKLDTDWRAIRREVPWLRRAPSEYVREHVRLTTEPLDVPDVATLVDVLEQLGSDAMLMYASDFPHEHGSAVSDWQTVLTGERLERLLSRNAEECYGERLTATVAG